MTGSLSERLDALAAAAAESDSAVGGRQDIDAETLRAVNRYIRALVAVAKAANGCSPAIPEKSRELSQALDALDKVLP